MINHLKWQKCNVRVCHIQKKNFFVLTKCATINLNFSPILFISSLKNTAVRPLSVKIVQNLKFMSTKQTYELRCEVRGSRPPPKISWWLGSTELTETKESVSENFPLSLTLIWINVCDLNYFACLCANLMTGIYENSLSFLWPYSENSHTHIQIPLGIFLYSSFLVSYLFICCLRSAILRYASFRRI